MREEGVILKHQSDATVFRLMKASRSARQLAVDEDPSGARRLDAGCNPKESGFAAAGMTEQTHEFARLDRQRDLVEHIDFAICLDEFSKVSCAGIDAPAVPAGPSAADETDPSPGRGSFRSFVAVSQDDRLEEIVLIERILVVAQGICRRRGPGPKDRTEPGLRGSPRPSAPRGREDRRWHRGRNGRGSAGVVP